MTNIYITKQGSILRHSDKSLIIEYQKEKVEQIPLLYVDRILIFGNIQVTTQTIGLLLENGIDLSFFSYRGKLKGNLCSNKSKNVFVRLAQVEKFKDKNFKISLIREIVRGKLNNQLKLVKKYSYYYEKEDFSSEIKTIEKVTEELDNRIEVDELMGLEGAGSVAYFKFFSKVMKGDFVFEGRKYYPSTDPINAMLSLGYTMITNEISGLLEANSFDPYIGFFHGIRYGRQSLPLDLVEEFRQPVVDNFTLKLINKKVFTKVDFEINNDGSCYFTEASLKTYFSKYEDLMNKIVKDDNSGEKNYRDFFKRQVERLSKVLMNNEKYQAFS